MGSPKVDKTDSEALKKLCMASEGVLYQDEYIQIGFKSEYSKGMGRMMLYYGNVSSQPLTGFTPSIPSVSYLNINAVAVANVLNPQSQVQQLVTMTCISNEATEQPSLHLSFK